MMGMNGDGVRRRVLDGVVEGRSRDDTRGRFLESANERDIRGTVKGPVRALPFVVCQLGVVHRVELGACEMPAVQANENGLLIAIMQ